MDSPQRPTAATPENPITLPPRYEIRRLTPHETEWVKGLLFHSHLYNGSFFRICYSENRIQRFHALMQQGTHIVEHQIASGMSFGVFDLDYEYKDLEAQAVGGKFSYTGEEEDGDAVLRAMDFPLVSIALSYDGFTPLDPQKMTPMLKVLPLYWNIHLALDAMDKDLEKRKPTRPGQLLARHATSTRPEYEGQGIMGVTARWLMREAKLRGFERIKIEALSDAVTYVWTHPPEPFKAEIVADIFTGDYEEEGEDGVRVNPFAPVRQRITRTCVEL